MWPQVPSPPIVVVIAGLPAVGKGTLARALSARTGIRHVDIDDNVRLPIFGLPHPNSYIDPILMEKGRIQMGFAYDGLLQIAIRGHLALGESIIVTATFSRPLARENLKKIMVDFPNAILKVIWCVTRKPEPQELEEVQRRLNKRRFGVDYFGGCNSVAHYLNDKGRYPTMDLPHVEIDTLFSELDECAAKAAAYIKE